MSTYEVTGIGEKNKTIVLTRVTEAVKPNLEELVLNSIEIDGKNILKGEDIHFDSIETLCEFVNKNLFKMKKALGIEE